MLGTAAESQAAVLVGRFDGQWGVSVRAPGSVLVRRARGVGAAAEVKKWSCSSLNTFKSRPTLQTELRSAVQ